MSGRRGVFAAVVGLVAIAGCGGSHATSSHTTSVTTTTPAPAPAHATASTPARPHPAVIHRVLAGQIPDRIPTSRHVVALTFDAGADNVGAPMILSVLARTGATATFFMTGKWAELYPQWARRIAVRYPIANHTYDHTDLLSLSLDGVRNEVLGAMTAMKRVTGRPPVPLFRFPYGSSSASALGVVNRLGYTAVGWTVDTLGWEGTSMGQSVESVIERAVGHIEPGEIVLMHVGSNGVDHSTLDAHALAAIIAAVRARGYKLVTLPPYL
jgi:peptidoglycan/xylan/chitin deacetylase (PgdA/CDA1 family)